jgi:glutaredoxin
VKPTAIPAVVLYSKPDCHLCDIVKERLAVAREQVAFDLETVDITTRPDLWERYRERIPVVVINGEEAFVYRVSQQQLIRRLSQAM